MKIQEATRRETAHIALGTLAFSAVMNLVFLLLGRWDITVLWGTLLGGGFAVLNFFLLGLSIQRLAAAADEKRGRAALQLSYSTRMLATVLVAALAVALPCFCWPAAVIPLFFPRLTIFAMQLMGMYKPEKANTPEAQNPKGGDEPV